MFKERFFILRKRGAERQGESRSSSPDAVSPKAKRQEKARQLRGAKEKVEGIIEQEATVERADKAEEVAVDLVTANISAAVIPELMEQLLNGEVKANGRYRLSLNQLNKSHT